MPNFKLNKGRVLLAAFAAGFIALMCAGPGTIILLTAAPESVKLLGKVVCPAGTSMRARWERYGYSRPGESNLEITCADESGESSKGNAWWFPKLFGLYFSLMLVPLLYVTLTAGASSTGPKVPPRLSSEAELEIRKLMEGGARLEAIKRVSELTGADLKAAKDYVESLSGR